MPNDNGIGCHDVSRAIAQSVASCSVIILSSSSFFSSSFLFFHVDTTHMDPSISSERSFSVQTNGLTFESVAKIHLSKLTVPFVWHVQKSHSN